MWFSTAHAALCNSIPQMLLAFEIWLSPLPSISAECLYTLLSYAFLMKAQKLQKLSSHWQWRKSKLRTRLSSQECGCTSVSRCSKKSGGEFFKPLDVWEKQHIVLYCNVTLSWNKLANLKGKKNKIKKCLFSQRTEKLDWDIETGEYICYISSYCDIDVASCTVCKTVQLSATHC